MVSKSPNPMPRFYTLSDAMNVLHIKPELVYQALDKLPALRKRYNFWTIEDLVQLNNVIQTRIVPRLGRGAP